MVVILSLFITMVSLITWAIPNVMLCMGDEGVGPLSPAYGEAIRNKRYKLCRIWAAIGCIGGLILAYAACYW